MKGRKNERKKRGRREEARGKEEKEGGREEKRVNWISLYLHLSLASIELFIYHESTFQKSSLSTHCVLSS